MTKSFIFLFMMLTARSATAEMIENDHALDVQVTYPMIVREIIELRPLALPVDSAESVEQVQERLVNAIQKYEDLTYVPYVWGGTSIGTKSQCKTCVACLKKTAVSKNLSFLADEDNPCKSCEKCGIDCSNLAHQIMSDAKIEFPYLTARDMAKYPRNKLEEKYNLVDVGSDITQAQPGDLLVQRKHVMIFIGFSKFQESVDYIHSSRRGEDERPFGGINVVKDRPIESIQKTIVKILRPRQTLKTTAAAKPIVAKRSNRLLTSK